MQQQRLSKHGITEQSGPGSIPGVNSQLLQGGKVTSCYRTSPSMIEYSKNLL